MNKNWEARYYSSPVWLQNLAVTGLGAKLYRERYGRDATRMLRELRASETWDAGRLGEHIDSEVRRMVHHAFTQVPYYRRLSAQLGLTSRDIRGRADLIKLPPVDGAAVRERPEDFVADSARSKRNLVKLSTSGTSGSPMTVFCDRTSRRRHYAFWARLREWFGISAGMHRATFFGRVICLPDQIEPPFWRYDRFQRNHLFSSYHLSTRNLGAYCEALERFQPPEIIGYPSSLSAVARYILEHGSTGIQPRVVFTTAETLLSHQRSMIEEAFRTRVVDQYGCTEMALFVSQCERGTYHVHPEHGVVEVLDSSGQPVADGMPGEAVCTGLVNSAMPLLRYRLRDRIVLEGGQCACGRNFPIVREITGRMDDELMTPSGRLLGRLDPVFKPLSGIRETQIIQDASDHLLVKVAADASFSDADRASLLYELKKRTGAEMTIDLVLVPEIPKDKNGKFRAVVSRLR